MKNINARETTTADLGPTTLLPAFALNGRVIGQDGRPIRNARIRFVPTTVDELPASERLLLTRVSLSDAKGRYRVAGIEPGMYRVRSEAAGWPDAVIDSLAVNDRDLHVDPLVHSTVARIEVTFTPPVVPGSSSSSHH